MRLLEQNQCKGKSLFQPTFPIIFSKILKDHLGVCWYIEGYVGFYLILNIDANFIENGSFKEW